MSRRPQAAEAARLLRQRLELGASELFLDDLDREEALHLAARARTGGPAPGPGAPGASSAVPPSPSGSGAPAGRGAPASDAGPLPTSYDALREVALACTRCRLAETRTQVVFSDGSVEARLVVVGEAPGANEDATGLPFVGQAGKFLDLLLAAIDLSRKDSVYIANVLKCRPPGNRNPQADEIEACSPFLRAQLSLVRPRALLAVGTFAAQLLTGLDRPLGRLRGEVHAYEGVPLVVTYHPAALLRNPRWTRPVWHDLQLLRQVMDGA